MTNEEGEMIDSYVGKRFGYLTVVRATPKRQRGLVVWELRCDCGVKVHRTTNHLLNMRRMKTRSACKACAAKIRHQDGDRNRKWDARGETIAEVAERLGVSRDAIKKRIARGWSVERVLSQPNVFPNRKS